MLTNFTCFFIRNYTLSITDSTTNITSTVTVVNETSQTFENLQPSVFYDITIAANDDFGELPNPTQRNEEITRKNQLFPIKLLIYK